VGWEGLREGAGKFLKFLRVWGGFKLCGCRAGADKKFQPAQDSITYEYISINSLCTMVDAIYKTKRKYNRKTKPFTSVNSHNPNASLRYVCCGTSLCWLRIDMTADVYINL